jgi:serine/threonine-protein kinase
MELLEGQLLSTRLRGGPMSWRRAAQLCAQVAAALAAAHARGVVHRDIKPSNVMLTAAGAKVLDFGVAGLAGSPEEDEVGGTLFGTPAYLAPERLLSDVVVAATDVYALGLLLYRCLTDRLPWDADTPTQMIENHVYEPPSPLPAIDGLPPVIGQLVARCLAKNPDDRPSAVETAQVLSEAASIHVVLPDTDGSTTQDVANRATEPATERQKYSRRRRGVLMSALAATMVGVTAVLVTCAVVRDDRVSAQPACRVNFFIRPDGNRIFTARLSILNTGKHAQNPWQVAFQFPDGEQISHSDGATFTQEGTTIRLSSGEALPPGKAVTVGLTGTAGGRPRQGPPSEFSLNGATCETRHWGGRDLPAVTGVTDRPSDFDATHEPPRPPGPPGGRDGPGGPGDGPSGPPPG